MARRVVTAPDALEALREARSWLTQEGSGRNGRARWEALRDKRKQLQTYPYLSAALDGRDGLDQVVMSDDRMIYEIDPDTGDSATEGDVTVVAIFGPGQP